MHFDPDSHYQQALIKDYQLRYGPVKGKRKALKEIRLIGRQYFTKDIYREVLANNPSGSEFNDGRYKA